MENSPKVLQEQFKLIENKPKALNRRHEEIVDAMSKEVDTSGELPGSVNGIKIQDILKFRGFAYQCVEEKKVVIKY